MKRLTLILLPLAIAGCCGTAPRDNGYVVNCDRSAREEIAENPAKALSLCQTYPAEEACQPPAPKGYEPFYISHYSRHGSRFLHREDYYTDPYEVLEKAAADGQLTELGESVRERIGRQFAQAKGKTGDFTQVAEKEHRGIAERMVLNYPAIFRRPGARVDSRSTTSARVVLSMAANNQRLKELCPGLTFTRSASDSYEALGKKYPMVGRDSIYRISYAMVKNDIDIPTVAARLFKDPSWVKNAPRFERDLWHIYYMVTNLGCLDIRDYDYNDLFDEDQMYVLWRAMNFLMHASCANSEFNGDEVLESAKPMLADIVERAQAAIDSRPLPDPDGSNGEAVHAADLRFGHDVYLLPLAALIGAAGEYGSDPYEIDKVWRFYNIAPMAGNIQLVFFAPKKDVRMRERALLRGDENPPALDNGKVLVQVLMNERAVKLAAPQNRGLLPAPEPVEATLYKWAELKEWFDYLLKTEFVK